MRHLRSPFRALPPEVAVLTAVAFSVALGFGIVAPAIPLFAKDFGVTNFAASAVISVFALVRFVSAPVAGRLVNRLGERVVLAAGIGIVGISSLLAGLSGSYAQLVVLRGVGGFGSAMFTVSAALQSPASLVAGVGTMPTTPLTSVLVIFIQCYLIRVQCPIPRRPK